jgi:hypothetical protein
MIGPRVDSPTPLSQDCGKTGVGRGVCGLHVFEQPVATPAMQNRVILLVDGGVNGVFGKKTNYRANRTCVPQDPQTEFTSGFVCSCGTKSRAVRSFVRRTPHYNVHEEWGRSPAPQKRFHNTAPGTAEPKNVRFGGGGTPPTPRAILRDFRRGDSFPRGFDIRQGHPNKKLFLNPAVPPSGNWEVLHR